MLQLIAAGLAVSKFSRHIDLHEIPIDFIARLAIGFAPFVRPTESSRRFELKSFGVVSFSIVSRKRDSELFKTLPTPKSEGEGQ